MEEVKRMPERTECVLPVMLDARAEQQPDKVFALFENGRQWTYQDAQEVSQGTAEALSNLGVSYGDNVLVWLPSNDDIVRVHFGLSYLGAVFVPVNLSLRGSLLGHVINLTGANLLICHTELADRLEHVDLCNISKIVFVGGEPTQKFEGVEVLSESSLDGDASKFVPSTNSIEPWTVQAMYFTSGTTGPSKAVPHTHLQSAVYGAVHLKLCNQDDRWLVNTPYFHLAATLVPFGVLIMGMSFAMLENYRTSTYWDFVRKTGSTCCMMFGSIPAFLMKEPERPDDADTPMRLVNLSPVIQDYKEFKRRFGVEVITSWDSTEAPTALISDVISEVPGPGFCGQIQPNMANIELRLLDENDCEVELGEAGECAIRSDLPWVVAPEYYKNPEATAKAWRNGWFHTGDMMRKDAQGNFFFVDRTKDMIRRRGENISSLEVEQEILSHPSVGDAAVLSVTDDEKLDEEVLAVVVPISGKAIDEAELFAFLRERMAHFALPRYIRVLDQLPYTETKKIQKPLLRSEGVTPETWDRVAEGIIVKGTKLGT